MSILPAALALAFSVPTVSAQGFVLDYDTAVQLAQLPLDCYRQEYPHKYGLTFSSSSELVPPFELHPTFGGCFDWHSSVHGHWMLAALANRFPGTELAETVAQVLDEQITPDKISSELEVFDPSGENPEFERTYGWAWLLKLAVELRGSPLDGERGWSSNLRPLSDSVADLFRSYLPDLLYPIRVGEHTNTAFGFIFALEYARATGDSSLGNSVLSRASDFFSSDSACPIDPWEPSGNDFLSPCLQEADLQRWLLPDNPESFAAWLIQFLPELFDEGFHLEPGHVSDSTDGKLVHLHGLNFSRAWNLYNLAMSLPVSFSSERLRLFSMGDEHLSESYGEVVDSDYAGAHWLATFLVEALLRREASAEALGLS